jgi:hypothetical protein
MTRVVHPELVEGRMFVSGSTELVEGLTVRGFDKLTTNGPSSMVHCGKSLTPLGL